MSIFESLEMLPDDPILSLNTAFADEMRPFKVNLGVGSYQTADGKSIVLSAIRKAEELLLEHHLNKEYLPIEGDRAFLQEALKLIFGIQHPVIEMQKIASIQTLGGTGALRIGGELLMRIQRPTIFVSDPTWPNHKSIFARAGMMLKTYPYYNTLSQTLDFNGMLSAISQAPQGSVILLHGCCHNPTGLDLSFEQWKDISALIKKLQHIPFFDVAYQGFDQNLDADAQSVRYFAEQGHEMFVSYSFSKNFGLYGERVGLLCIVTKSQEFAAKVTSQVKTFARASYSTPPSHGEQIVTTVLQHPELYKEWKNELGNMRDRIKAMRKSLMSELLAKTQSEKFSFIGNQKGLFSFCGLKPEQVSTLRQEYAIFMPPNGRINIAGLNAHNIHYVVDAILSILNHG